ncbi:MAG: GNAT family N-acetyltransferase, partial [Marinibacterium sp.]
MTAPGIRIRTATMADLAGVDALLARAYPRLLKPDYPPSVLVTALPLISRANPVLLRSGSYFVAQAPDGAIVGAGGWTRDGRVGGLGHVRHVVTDDRVVRRGIGRAVLSQVFDTATDAGMTRLDCWSTRTAVRFYTALGFELRGEMDLLLAPGITFPAIALTRSLPV